MGFSGSASGKEPTCQCRRHTRHGFSINFSNLAYFILFFSTFAWISQKEAENQLLALILFNIQSSVIVAVHGADLKMKVKISLPTQTAIFV